MLLPPSCSHGRSIGNDDDDADYADVVYADDVDIDNDAYIDVIDHRHNADADDTDHER